MSLRPLLCAAVITVASIALIAFSFALPGRRLPPTRVQIRTGHIPKLLKINKLELFLDIRFGVSIPHKLIPREQKKVQTDEKKPLVTDIGRRASLVHVRQ